METCLTSQGTEKNETEKRLTDRKSTKTQTTIGIRKLTRKKNKLVAKTKNPQNKPFSKPIKNIQNSKLTLTPIQAGKAKV